MNRKELPAVYSKVESVRQPAGVILVDGQTVADTLQCVHCNRHWIPIKGSGRKRGFCRECMGPLCGSKECMTCVPFEKKLEDQERRFKQAQR
jgi:hypothetical protein